jgi:hypothetical protein
MQSTDRKDLGQKIMLAAGFLAAGLFVLVSMAANLKFGLSLATTPFDRIIYGALSLAADLMKVALPLVAILLWRKKHRFFAAIAALFCVGAIGYSLAAAIGFAASTRSESVTANQLIVGDRKAWEAKIERTAQQLDRLGVPRSGGVIQAEIDARLRNPGADDCKIINGPITNEVCPKVDALRQELAVSRRAAELETELVVDRNRLRAAPVAASVADPQSATLSRLTALGEAKIRDIIAILIAVLVEFGSALGFTFVLLASRSATAVPACAVQMAKGPANTAPKPKRRPVKPGIPIKLSETPADTVTRWAFSRLDVLRAGRIQAEVAYRDFVAWCEAGGIEACSGQMFGRRFTEVVKGMGGRKVKINGRAYYEGVVLQRRSAQIQRDLAMAA